MRFAPIASVLALAAAANAQVSASMMQSNIDQITELSSDTNNIAETISITNMFYTAPQIINNFKQIITTAANDVTSMQKRSLQARQDCLDVEDIEKCVEDLGEIVEDPSEILGRKKKRQSPPAYSETDQQAICSSFRGFVHVHQQLLQTVIGKHGLLSITPFTRPIAQILRTLEGGVDQLAFGIIDTVPSCAQDATQNKNSLDMTLQQSVQTYSEQ